MTWRTTKGDIRMELTIEDFVGGLGKDDGDIDDVPFAFKRMKKMNKKDEEKFPGVVADSIRCQMYYISKCEKCNGCEFAVEGCEKVVEMSAG